MTRAFVVALAIMVAGMASGLVGAFVLNLTPQAAGLGARGSGFMTYVAALSLVGLVGAIAVGLPGHALLSRLGRTRRPAYVLVGLLGGLIMGLILSGLRPEGWQAVIVGMAGGAAGGLAFWLIARPDRTAA